MDQIKDLVIFFCKEGILENKNGVSRLLKTDFTPVKSIVPCINGGRNFYLILDSDGHLYRIRLDDNHFEKLSFDFLIRDISIKKSDKDRIIVMILSRDFKIYRSTIHMDDIVPKNLHYHIPENIYQLNRCSAISENIENLYSISQIGQTTLIIKYIQSDDKFHDGLCCNVLFFIDNDGNLILYKSKDCYSVSNPNSMYKKLLLNFGNTRFENIYGTLCFYFTFVNIVTDNMGFGYILKINNCRIYL